MRTIPEEVLVPMQTFGFFPLRFSGDDSLQFSPLLYAWGLGLVSVQVVLAYVTLYMDYTSYRQGDLIRMKDTTTVVAVFLDVSTISLISIVVTLSTTRNYKRFIEMTRMLERFDQTFQGRTDLFMIRIKVVCILILTITLEVATAVVRIHENPYNVLYVPAYSIYYMQSASIFILFTFLAQSITERFRMINDKIKETVMKQSMGHLIKDLGLPTVDGPGKTKAKPQQPVYHIKTLMDSYALLCELVQKANAFYGSQLLVTIFSSFVHIIITLYFFFLAAWPSTDSFSVKTLALQGVWSIVHISHLVLIIKPCSALADSAAETAPTVCQLTTTDLCPQLRKQLETFLLQLLHYSAKFSALGFFQLHNHILTSIASSVTTYLVIMIQFQASSQ